MSDTQPEPELTETEVFEQKAVRLAKRERLNELGGEALDGSGFEHETPEPDFEQSE